MVKKLMIPGLVVVVVAAALAAAQEPAGSEGQAAKPPAAGQATSGNAWQPAEEQAIRAAVQTFAKAYDAHDAKAVAALFAPDAEAIDNEGTAVQGREAIEQVYTRIFKENPKTRIEVAVSSIRFMSPTVAIEDGASTVTHAANEPPERSRYTVLHAKREGKWQMASARDLSDGPSSAEEQLRQLAWMIGDWVDESPESLIVTSYRWADNHCYILGEFTIRIAGRPAMTGSQRIGWDPLAKKLRSWVFDSQGSFGEATWTRDGSRWIAKSIGVTREGKPASATNVTTQIGKDRMTWESRDRVVGGQVATNIEPVTVVRKPPRPK
jgi:uncharacterized protein (TIGR02246 family)